MRNAIMTSSNGNFTLCKKIGIGRADTEYTTLEVVSSGDADKYVVEIRFNSNSPSFEGKPVKYEIRDCYISYGYRLASNTDQDIKTFIEVLNEALEFENRIKDYINSVGNDY